MPELPEVETVRRGLEPAMVGARIQKVEMRRKDIRFPFPLHFRERLTGRRIAAVARRAKYLLFQLDGGETLIAHLGMSGSFRIEAAETTTPGAFHHERSKDPKHDHVVLHLDNGRIVTYNDPRRFGFMDLVASETAEAHPRLIGLGEEPLAAKFDAQRLAKLFAGSRSPLKSALLDQKRVAGLGNIYVCEVTFSRPPFATAARLKSGGRRRKSNSRRPCAGQGHPRGARGSDRSRRLDPARPSPRRWRAGLFPARIRGLRPGRLALPATALPRNDRANSNNPVGRRSIVRYARSNA